MKTFSIILAAFAVIAAASADSNAICNGQIGNHAIQERGTNYIACTENTNGEIIPEILTCDHADHIWCEHSGHCCLPEHCVVIPGHHGDITIEINNKVSGGDCSTCDDSSSSESSSSSSSSEEDEECRHGHHLQWFEHCEKNGCFPKCVEDHHDTRDIGASSCHHHDNDYLACCNHGTCVADTIGHSTCRGKDEDCPTGTTCCGKGCNPCPNPTSNPNDCKDKCCPSAPHTSGLFGSSFRGQIQTDECKPCDAGKFFCKTTKNCEPKDTNNADCIKDLLESCHCHKIPFPGHCDKFYWHCVDLNQDIEGHCPPGHLFWPHVHGTGHGDCVPHGHAHWWNAQGACLCKDHPGFEPQPNGCGYKCCPHSLNTILGLESNNDVHTCVEKSCGTGNFYCSAQKSCLPKGTPCSSGSYDQQCCTTVNECFKSTKTCEGVPVVKTCAPPLVYCPNTGECGHPDDKTTCGDVCVCIGQPEHDITTIGNDVCCPKNPSKIQQFRDLVMNMYLEKCGSDNLQCQGCPLIDGHQYQACGNACIPKGQECKNHPFNKLDKTKVCKDCTGVEGSTCLSEVYKEGDDKHFCNLVAVCKKVGGVFIVDNIHQCHQPGEGDCKVCTVAQLLAGGYHVDEQPGCIREHPETKLKCCAHTA